MKNWNLCKSQHFNWFIMAWKHRWLTYIANVGWYFYVWEGRDHQSTSETQLLDAAFCFMYEAFSGTTISTSHGTASHIWGELWRAVVLCWGREKKVAVEGPCVTRVEQETGDKDGLRNWASQHAWDGPNRGSGKAQTPISTVDWSPSRMGPITLHWEIPGWPETWRTFLMVLTYSQFP